MDYSVSTNCKE